MGTIITNENITPQQAWDRFAAVYNLRIRDFADFDAAVGRPEYAIPPGVSLQGVAIAPDSIIPQALIDWRPAGLVVPASGVFPNFHAFQAAGNRILVTRDKPLTLPLTGPVVIRPFVNDLYGAQFQNLAGAATPLTIVSLDTSAPMVCSLVLWLRTPPTYGGGARVNAESGWIGVNWPANAGGEQIIAIVPTHGRQSMRWSFKTAAVAVDVRLTGISGRQVTVGSTTELREFLIPNLNGTIPANGNLTIESQIDCNYVVLRALSQVGVVTGSYQYTLSDHSGCCSQIDNT